MKIRVFLKEFVDGCSMHSNLNDETLFRLNKINKMEDYFTTEIKDKKQ